MIFFRKAGVPDEAELEYPEATFGLADSTGRGTGAGRGDGAGADAGVRRNAAGVS